MDKMGTRVLAITMLAAMSIWLPACKEDEPPVPPKLSFAESTLVVKESDGEISVKVVLDKPAPRDIEIEYSIRGTAGEQTKIGNSGVADYRITSKYLEIEIDAGETEGEIVMELYSDYEIEDDETIELRIEDADNNVEITRNDDIIITLKQEDGMVAVLQWPAGTPTSYADMDILVRAGQSIGTWDQIIIGSAQGSFTGPEFVFLPFALSYNAYGLSFVYYEGTLDPLGFSITYANLFDGEFEPQSNHQTFGGEYTLANINTWQDPSTTKVVQTFTKSNGRFGNISPIQVPTSGSRTIIPPLHDLSLFKTIKRHKSSVNFHWH